MVKAFHRVGIEVILDVVYNHTGEGSELGPTLCFRGIDNAAYYRLDPANHRRYIDFTGCGNTFNVAHPRALQLVLDSLRYWVSEMHVDGFRFDLATALARDPVDFDGQARFFAMVQQDPVLARREADRRALGPRDRRLSARRLSAGLGGVERALSRLRAPLLARRRRSGAGARVAAVAARATSFRAAIAARTPASTSSPVTTASRSPIW